MYNFFCEIEKFWFKQIELNIKETTVIFFVVCLLIYHKIVFYLIKTLFLYPDLNI